MKKILFILVFLLSLGIAAESQDTVHSNAPKRNYFYNNWAHGDSLMRSGFRFGSDFIEQAVAYHTDNPLQIVGLAISLRIRDNMEDNPDGFIQDTTMDSIYCFVRLYKAFGDSLHVIAEKRIHMRDTSVSYTLALNQTNRLNLSGVMDMEPVYECFFDTPVTVIDSFYVGWAFDKDRTVFDSNMNQCVNQYRCFFASTGFLGSRESPILKEPITMAYRRSHNYSDNSGAPGTWIIDVKYRPFPYYFMYAIYDTTITSIDTTVTPIDTTVVPTDTTAGIGKVDMVNRYVSVSPNPAGDRATVLSSFGLTAIEAYDPQGRKLYSAPAEGLKATLDVSAWPRGTVLLHIHTPAGTAVKKLLLR